MSVTISAFLSQSRDWHKQMSAQLSLCAVFLVFLLLYIYRKLGFSGLLQSCWGCDLNLGTAFCSLLGLKAEVLTEVK